MEGGRSVSEFCSTEVEPMFKESDHIHIIGTMIKSYKLTIFITYEDLLLPLE